MFLKERKRSSLTTVITFKPVRIFAARATNSFDHVDFFCGINSIVQTGLPLFQRPEFFCMEIVYIFKRPEDLANLKAMFQFESIETRVLIEMLAQYTNKFTRLFRIYKRINLGKGYLRCKYTIEAILNALNKRGGLKEEKEMHISRYEAVCLSGLKLLSV